MHSVYRDQYGALHIRLGVIFSHQWDAVFARTTCAAEVRAWPLLHWIRWRDGRTAHLEIAGIVLRRAKLDGSAHAANKSDYRPPDEVIRS